MYIIWLFIIESSFADVWEAFRATRQTCPLLFPRSTWPCLLGRLEYGFGQNTRFSQKKNYGGINPCCKFKQKCDCGFLDSRCIYNYTHIYIYIHCIIYILLIIVNYTLCIQLFTYMNCIIICYIHICHPTVSEKQVLLLTSPLYPNES